MGCFQGVIYGTRVCYVRREADMSHRWGRTCTAKCENVANDSVSHFCGRWGAARFANISYHSLHQNPAHLLHWVKVRLTRTWLSHYHMNRLPTFTLCYSTRFSTFSLLNFPLLLPTPLLVCFEQRSVSGGPLNFFFLLRHLPFLPALLVVVVLRLWVNFQAFHYFELSPASRYSTTSIPPSKSQTNILSVAVVSVSAYLCFIIHSLNNHHDRTTNLSTTGQESANLCERFYFVSEKVVNELSSIPRYSWVLSGKGYFLRMMLRWC